MSWPWGPCQATKVYEGALTQAPTDHRLHENFAEFLEAIGELQPAAVEWQRVRELTPHHHLGYFQQGRLLARLGQLSQAQSALRAAVTLRPDLSEGWFELGKLHFSDGKPALAWQEFKRCEELIPGGERGRQLFFE
jgi:tetratricopeptide (TPR) repeat protein